MMITRWEIYSTNVVIDYMDTLTSDGDAHAVLVNTLPAYF